MISPIGFGWVTGHLAAKHPLLACAVIGCTALGSVVYANVPKVARLPAAMPKVAVITFDDGFRSDIEIAAPILAEYGFVATFYAALDGKSYALTPRQISTLVDFFGWEYGHHTYNHPHLPALTPDKIAAEIAMPWKEGVTAFASPYGEYTPEIIDALKKQGYTSHVKATDNFDGGNWIPLKDPYQIERYVYRAGSDLYALCRKPRDPRNALVVAFHKVVEASPTAWDGLDNGAWTIEAGVLDRFIRCLSDEGFQSLTISDLVERGK